MAGYSEEQRVFINNLKLEGKQISEIQLEFKEKYNRIPAPVTINKYGRYHLWGKGREELPDAQDEKPKDDVVKDEPKDDDAKTPPKALEIDVKDTRKEKKEKSTIIDFSDGEIDEKDFAKIVALRGTNNSETWEFLNKCGKKGYNKIDLSSGEISE